MTEGVEGTVNGTDTILMWGETAEQHDQRLANLLQRAREWNLKLNKDKRKIRTSEIKYIGHALSADGLKPDEDEMRAVVQRPSPENNNC